jgi:hypothetical protein
MVIFEQPGISHLLNNLTINYMRLSIYTFIKIGFIMATYTIANGQDVPTRQDTLRGSLTKERTWWDVQKYEIDVRPDFPSKTIRGFAKIHFKVVKPGDVMQICKSR